MKKKLYLIGVACLMAFLPADAFQLQSTFSEDIVPERTIERDDSGITVTYKFPGAIMVQDDLYPECVRLDIPLFGHHGELEEPAWPVRGDSFEIPYGYDASVSVIVADWCDLDISLAPARPPLIDSSDEVYSLDNVPPIKDFTGALPETPVEIYDRQIYRDRMIAYVAVAPVKYDKVKTMVCEKLIYRIDFAPSKSVMKVSSGKIRHEIDEEHMRTLYSSTTLEDGEVIAYASAPTTRWRPAPNYLILSIPEYKSSVDKFAEWKKCMGFNTEVIYASDWTATSIKNQIKSKYEVQPRLQYVLLVGDALSMPPVRYIDKYGTGYNHYSDHTFGCMDGDHDMTQDLFLGRLNVSNSVEASIVIDKIINYEKNPPTSSSFYTNALHGAYFQNGNPSGYELRRFTRTSEDIRNGLQNEDFSVKRVYSTNSPNPSYWNIGSFAYGEPLPIELKKPNFSWNGSETDIINAINSGTFYIFHRGHGSFYGWSSPEFNIKTLSNLNNGTLQPVCFSINCQSGAFSNTEIIVDDENKTYMLINQSFSEQLLRKNNGGAVGIIAASEISFSGPNDVMAMEMFQAIWPNANVLTDFPNYSSNSINHNLNPAYRLGQILDRGKMALNEKYTDGNFWTPYTKSIFHCFGDPAMQIHTSLPHNVTLTVKKFPGTSTPILIASENVQVALILRDGSVLVATGTQFDMTETSTQINQMLISKYVVTGHDINPIVKDLTQINPLDLSDSSPEIVNISKEYDSIEVEYAITGESDASIRLRKANASYGNYHEYPANDRNVIISTTDLEKGIYVIELVVDGFSVDTKKIAL